jgi:hypothetical protein
LAASGEKQYAQLLGEAIFHDEVRDAFVRAVAEAKADNDNLRVLLFVEAEDLYSLHWEQLAGLFDRGWDYLLLNQGTPFSLYLPSQIERRFPPIGRRDLRALVLVAGPEELAGDYKLAQFDVAATVRSVTAPPRRSARPPCKPWSSASRRNSTRYSTWSATERSTRPRVTRSCFYPKTMAAAPSPHPS